jgi:uncharacterized small protein (DUF1192 family)
MQLPFISRAAHEEIVALLRERIAELKAQLHPPAAEPVAAEPPQPMVSRDEFEIERERTKARLRSIMRTKPSLMGRVMADEMARAEVERRQRAHGTHPAQVLFNAAKQ